MAKDYGHDHVRGHGHKRSLWHVNESERVYVLNDTRSLQESVTKNIPETINIFPTQKLIIPSRCCVLGSKFFNMLVENPITKMGRLWPNAKLKKTTPEYNNEPLMAIKLAMSSKTAPQQGQAGISKKAKSIPNIKADGNVLTLLTAFSQWALIPHVPKEISPVKNNPPKIIKNPKTR